MKYLKRFELNENSSNNMLIKLLNNMYNDLKEIYVEKYGKEDIKKIKYILQTVVSTIDYKNAYVDEAEGWQYDFLEPYIVGINKKLLNSNEEDIIEFLNAYDNLINDKYFELWPFMNKMRMLQYIIENEYFDLFYFMIDDDKMFNYSNVAIILAEYRHKIDFNKYYSLIKKYERMLDTKVIAKLYPERFDAIKNSEVYNFVHNTYGYTWVDERTNANVGALYLKLSSALFINMTVTGRIYSVCERDVINEFTSDCTCDISELTNEEFAEEMFNIMFRYIISNFLSRNLKYVKAYSEDYTRLNYKNFCEYLHNFTDYYFKNDISILSNINIPSHLNKCVSNKMLMIKKIL
jgi:hypothetical protein